MAQEGNSTQVEQLLRMLQQIHATLRENLDQQNDRITRLEEQIDPNAQRPPLGLGEKRINEALNSDGDPAPKAQPPKEAPFFADDFPEIMSIWPDPNQAIQTNISAPTSWRSTTLTHYMDLSPLPFVSTYREGILAHYLDWRQWFESKFWIPADRRLPLGFDIDHLNQCTSIAQAVSRFKAMHDFNRSLCNYNGRLLIIDNNTVGQNRICGNLVERRGWRRGFLGNRYSMHCDNDGNRLNRPINTHGLTEIPPMAWTTIDGTISGTRPAAPWRRLIIIEGLVGLRPKDHKDFRIDYGLNFWADPGSTGISQAIKHFLKASVQAFSSSDGYSFQYSWVFSISVDQIRRWSPISPNSDEIFESNEYTESTDLSWIRLLTFGRLYGSLTSMIARDAYYFKMVYSDSTDEEGAHSMNNYWSAVVFRRPSWKTHTSMLPIFHAQLQVLSHSNEALTTILEDTTEIVNHIGNLLEIGNEILLDPERHDQLLFDDEVFSRSRTYWWTLNMLTTMQQSLTEILTVHQEIWDAVIQPLLPMEDWPLDVPDIVNKDKTLVKELTKLQHRITLQHQRAEALRSGLFNASGVVESRASTRLGEIVKLLTYVSIFYLPLTFSTSLWSTTDSIRALDTAIMFGVMISAAALTYIIVFNLNNITRTVYRQYEAAKNPWIRRMKEEHDKKWKERAIRYSGFKIKRFDMTPSEWHVAWYFMTWPIRHYLLPKAPQIPGHHTTSHPSTNEPDKAEATDDPHDSVWLNEHPPFPDPEEFPAAAFSRSHSSRKIPPNAETEAPSKSRKFFSLPTLRRRVKEEPAVEMQRPGRDQV